jgi:hypothetical protein
MLACRGEACVVFQSTAMELDMAMSNACMRICAFCVNTLKEFHKGIPMAGLVRTMDDDELMNT